MNENKEAIRKLLTLGGLAGAAAEAASDRPEIEGHYRVTGAVALAAVETIESIERSRVEARKAHVVVIELLEEIQRSNA